MPKMYEPDHSQLFVGTAPSVSLAMSSLQPQASQAFSTGPSAAVCALL